jgi:hypothetical protein
MTKIILSVVVLVVLVGAIFMLQGAKQEEPVVQDQEQPQEEQKTISQILAENTATTLASLVAVNESDSEGMGYRVVQDGMFYHAVLASMPEPAEGSVYEGWLVQPEPLQFFSTGVMQKNEQGIWQLEYKADQDYPSYLRVVITEETVVDETPEIHIIEGDFPMQVTELQIEDIVVGTGAEAATGDTISAHYTGTFANGSKFDSSYDRGTPFSFELGAGNVIAGWDQGILGMKVGGKRKLAIPPSLGYGEAGIPGAIPPNSTLYFEVELVSVNAK